MDTRAFNPNVVGTEVQGAYGREARSGSPAGAESPEQSARYGEFRRVLSRVHPLVWLSILVLACLLPFVNKAFFIDDTLFLRAAEQIQKHPLDFYGFDINWFDETTPMRKAFENPPLTCYYIALVASIVGWSEPALHLAFLIPALGAAWGIFELAKRHCQKPLLAACIAVITPAFLVSATNVMCDVMLLGFWTWCLVFFETGLETRDAFKFVVCGVLGGLAVWTKFPALALVPLLCAYGLVKQRRFGWWVIAPILPLVFAGAYELLTRHLYGEGLLLEAAEYASKFRGDAHEALWEKIIVGLGFAGGCYLPALLYTPLVWPRRAVLAFLCSLFACLLFIPRMAAFTRLLWRVDGTFNWAQFLYIAALAVGGAQALLLAILDLWEQRDATSVLLLCWIAGIFVFAACVNWTINARSLLPAAPAVGILIARRLERGTSTGPSGRRAARFWPPISATALALLLVRADTDLANTYRSAARELFARYHQSGKQVWFGGDWGFQYYLEKLGAKPVEAKFPTVAKGDVVLFPYDAEGLTFFDSDHAKTLVELTRSSSDAFATMNESSGAGFYASVLGPLPFTVGPGVGQKFSAVKVTEAPGGHVASSRGLPKVGIARAALRAEP